MDCKNEKELDEADRVRHDLLRARGRLARGATDLLAIKPGRQDGTGLVTPGVRERLLNPLFADAYAFLAALESREVFDLRPAGQNLHHNQNKTRPHKFLRNISIWLYMFRSCTKGGL